MPNAVQNLLRGVVWRLPFTAVRDFERQNGKGEIPQQARNEEIVKRNDGVVRNEKKLLYLTFDDGPNLETTPLLLDLLRQNEIKATFFLVGENAQRYPELVEKIKSEGHTVGTHTFNHLKGWKTSTKNYLENVRMAERAVEPNSNLFRPPYGKMSIRQYLQIRKMHTIVLWDLITHDYDRAHSPEKIMQAVRKYSRDGSIVVFHDSLKAKDNLFAVLQEAIDFWTEEGYEFQPIRK